MLLNNKLTKKMASPSPRCSPSLDRYIKLNPTYSNAYNYNSPTLCSYGKNQDIIDLLNDSKNDFCAVNASPVLNNIRAYCVLNYSDSDMARSPSFSFSPHQLSPPLVGSPDMNHIESKIKEGYNQVKLDSTTAYNKITGDIESASKAVEKIPIKNLMNAAVNNDISGFVSTIAKDKTSRDLAKKIVKEVPLSTLVKMGAAAATGNAPLVASIAANAAKNKISKAGVGNQLTDIFTKIG